MTKTKKSGFALPTVLVVSMVMLVVLFVSVASTAATRSSLAAQYYMQIAKSASDAGAAYAKGCLMANNGTPLWTNSRPLKPGTDCAGNFSLGFTCPDGTTDARCYVMVDTNNNIQSSFSVAGLVTDAAGRATDTVSNGIVNLVRTSTQTAWRQYSQTSRTVIVWPTAQILIVGGGGGGGGSNYNQRAGGGGGAGGLIYYSAAPLNAQTYSLSVGAGGAGGAAQAAGSNGGSSQISGVGVVATGGGGGGRGADWSGAAGLNGGSGGGAGGCIAYYAGGVGLIGHNGGNNDDYNDTASGGGGGAIGVGGNASSMNIGGAGGLGATLSITGSNVTYAAGGPGSAGGTVLNGTAGTPNTGNGGGGGRGVNSLGGNGGSGVIIVSFVTGRVNVIATTGNPQIIYSGSNTIFVFKTVGNGSFTISPVLNYVII